MRATWRWFGPKDLVPVEWMLQAGVEGVVSALHHVATGEVWTKREIERRQAEIGRISTGEPSGLKWEVVESLPVSEAVKTQTGSYREHYANYRESLQNLADSGIEVVCYNFMPVLDWTRTDLRYRVAHGGACMRFDIIDFAAFDIHILRRDGAASTFPADVVEQAAERFAAMDDTRKHELTDNIVCGLPGSTETLTVDGLHDLLSTYDGIGVDRLRANFVDFLSEAVPTAEKLGIRLCCHPDDPPFPLLGLPRIMSTVDDYRAILGAVDSPANGATICTGSLGARPDNDLAAIVGELGSRIHFLHLRNVRRETPATAGSFYEAEHLGGDTDMPAVIAAVLREEERRRIEGRKDWNIPFRPDHGQDILDDLGRNAQPGYPAIGRLRGLAELRGVAAGLRHAAEAAL